MVSRLVTLFLCAKVRAIHVLLPGRTHIMIETISFPCKKFRVFLRCHLQPDSRLPGLLFDLSISSFNSSRTYARIAEIGLIRGRSPRDAGNNAALTDAAACGLRAFYTAVNTVTISNKCYSPVAGRPSIHPSSQPASRLAILSYFGMIG